MKRKPAKPATYWRGPDEMIEIAPNSYVNRAVAIRLGLIPEAT